MRTKRALNLAPIALVICLLGMAGPVRGAAVAEQGGEKSAVAPQDDLAQRWGIRILGLHTSAAGYLLDFRYRVLDPVKARPVLDRSVRPYLIDEASGRTLVVPSPPKVGSLRNSGTPAAGRNYFVLFGNPGKTVARGGRVVVVIGDLRVPDVVVE
jgi:hypothetical protein